MTPNTAPKYWIIVASKDHVESGVAGGIAQAGHGKEAPLKRMKMGDFVVCYSGKQNLETGGKCQEFTAIGTVKDGKIYQVEISENFKPFRRRVDYLPAKAVSVVPLIPQLEFIKNKESWGFAFRYGFFEINAHDFQIISEQMLKKR